MSRRDRYKKRVSDISGFDGFEHEMLKERGLWMFPDERDNPPPSKLSLGGEGDVNRGSYFRSNTNITVSDSGLDNPVQYITAAGGITPSFTHPYMRVVGSNSNINISANPQIAVGPNQKVLTLYGVGSTITIENGDGVATMGSAPFALGSGNSITLIFTTGGNIWQETSRFSGEGAG